MMDIYFLILLLLLNSNAPVRPFLKDSVLIKVTDEFNNFPVMVSVWSSLIFNTGSSNSCDADLHM